MIRFSMIDFGCRRLGGIPAWLAPRAWSQTKIDSVSPQARLSSMVPVVVPRRHPIKENDVRRH